MASCRRAITRFPSTSCGSRCWCSDRAIRANTPLGTRLGGRKLVSNLETLTRQLWQAGIRGVFADGSFAEDKDHPNDIDGYSVCGLIQLKTGELVRHLNLLDPFKRSEEARVGE